MIGCCDSPILIGRGRCVRVDEVEGFTVGNPIEHGVLFVVHIVPSHVGEWLACEALHVPLDESETRLLVLV